MYTVSLTSNSPINKLNIHFLVSLVITCTTGELSIRSMRRAEAGPLRLALAVTEPIGGTS
jgi:hypothetical protein